MDRQKVVIIGGVAILAGLGGYIAYRAWSDRQLGATAVPISARALEAQSDCEAACSADGACLAYSLNKTTGECVNTTKDPYSAAKEDPAWALYIKRDATAAPSSWSSWSECPSSCVPAGSAPPSQTRNCTGKCPGTSSKLCGSFTYCDAYEEMPAGFMPFGDPQWVRQDTAKSDEACRTLCQASNKCSAYMFDSSFKTCDIIGNGADMSTMSQDTVHPTASRVYVRMPGAGNGTWGPIVTKADCKCGEARHERTCSSGQGSCKMGFHYMICPNTPCFGFDSFDGLRA
ncbi:MAG: PAN domain-containing protein [Desulfosporosinus sp.]|nr:PAN domain-containing protein [Desulfosporosinus sp.]